tara:strand:+ start:13968 stop:14681 length:714 start_codon:yes stop_codon:yes gene_type:complete
MLNKITLSIITVGDYFHKNKIIKFLKKSRYNKFSVILDVGAHKGETIKFFIKNFDFEKIYAFEPVPEIFNKLRIMVNKLPKNKIEIENLAIGSNEKKILIKYMIESSSSTIRDINQNSNYFIKKKKFLYSDKQIFFDEIEVNQITLKKYLNNKSLKKIDILKIDTEGYEYEVLLGLEEKIKDVGLIMFEHHYHDMIKKNYTFSDIHKLLISNNFNQIFKSKMPFRKTFEYIYENKKI